MKLALARAYAATRIPHEGAVVLCYHSVAPGDGFAWQLDYLVAAGYTFATFGGMCEALRRGEVLQRLAVVTFDDGLLDTATTAWPIMVDRGIAGTCFVTTGLMDREERVVRSFCERSGYRGSFVSRGDVGRLAAEGMEIGAHTHTHRNMRHLDEIDAREELERSRAILSEVLGAPPVTMAYPYGKPGVHYTSASVAAARSVGFTSAATLWTRTLPAHDVDLFEVPRLPIPMGETRESFALRLRGAFDWLGAFQRASPARLRLAISPTDIQP